MNQLAEKDQVNVETNNLLHVYYNKVCALPIMDFKQPYNNEMRSVIGLNMVANPDRYPNLKGTLTHWVLLCQRSLFACARDVISNLWIQLLHQIHFQSIGYIVISTRGQAITLMIVHD